MAAASWSCGLWAAAGDSDWRWRVRVWAVGRGCVGGCGLTRSCAVCVDAAQPRPQDSVLPGPGSVNLYVPCTYDEACVACADSPAVSI